MPTSCPPAPPSTPYPADSTLFFGWYSEALQQLRVAYPSEHLYNGKIITRPPYCYWIQRDKKVLVTEVTHTSIPSPRQVKNGDICIGPVDKYVGRSYTMEFS